MRNPEFKDVLRELIEKNGGFSRGNMARLSDKIREVKPEFSVAYLRRLLFGQPPSRKDRLAISLVLEPPSKRWLSMYWEIEDLDTRHIAELASRYTRNPTFVRESVEYVLERVKYRDRSLSEDDVKIILREFYLENELKVEIEVFGLCN